MANTHRLLVAAAVLVYVAGSSWIVRNEGQAFRQQAREARLAATAPRDKTSPLPTQAEPRIADAPADRVPRPAKAASVADAPATAPSTIAATTVPAAAATSPAVSPSEKPTPARQPQAGEVAIASPPNSTVTKPSPPPTTPALAAPANPIASSVFWNQPHLRKSWDLEHLSLEDELRLGAELHDLIVQLNPTVDDSPDLRRIEEAAEPLKKHLLRKDLNYTFTVLDSDSVNAFSHPGGYVYVTRALFDLISEDEDYALQFAIGHEIAHVDLQHAIKCLKDKGLAKLEMGTLQKLYLIIIPFGYLIDEKANIDQEIEADDWICGRMQRLGHTRREILSFLQKLEGYSKKNGFYNGRVKPQPGAAGSPVENHYRSQTATWRRLKHLKELVKPS